MLKKCGACGKIWNDRWIKLIGQIIGDNEDYEWFACPKCRNPNNILKRDAYFFWLIIAGFVAFMTLITIVDLDSLFDVPTALANEHDNWEEEDDYE